MRTIIPFVLCLSLLVACGSKTSSPGSGSAPANEAAPAAAAAEPAPAARPAATPAAAAEPCDLPAASRAQDCAAACRNLVTMSGGEPGEPDCEKRCAAANATNDVISWACSARHADMKEHEECFARCRDGAAAASR